jgi:hypothetical protein
MFYTMNSNTQPLPRAGLLDPEWVIAIEDELFGNPAGLAFNVEPELMGRYCAEHGLACEPLAFGYRKLDDVEAFIIGFKEVTLLWAEMVTEINEAEYQRRSDEQMDLDEYLDWLDDQEWIRRGC